MLHAPAGSLRDRELAPNVEIASLPSTPVLGCQICGRGPAAMITLDRQVGMIVLSRHWHYRAALCRDHGSRLAREWLIQTCLFGWWGVISFALNVAAVAVDVQALRIARRLAPAGSMAVTPLPPTAPGTLPAAGPGPMWGQQSDPAPAVAPAQPRFRHPRLVALMLLGVVAAVALLAGPGLLSTANHGVGFATDLKVGDCFDVPSAQSTGVLGVERHPCTEAHTAEVFALITYPAVVAATYPADTAFDTFAAAQCQAAFQTYTGVPFQQATSLGGGFLWPASDGWSNGDRTVTCYLEGASGQTLTQSMRSTAP
jgi:hypothetical protein